MNYKEELSKIEKTIEENKLEKARLEERTKKLREDEALLFGQLKDEGLTYPELELKIVELESEIKKCITECQKIIGD